MTLLSIVYDRSLENIVNEEIKDIKELMEIKKIRIGIYESIEENTHFTKIMCSKCDENVVNTFNLYFANSLYKLIINVFCQYKLDEFVNHNYFFLRSNEIASIKSLVKKAFICEGKIIDETMIYYMNRKNDILKKIITCLEENDEINIAGFITFRIKEYESFLEDIVEKAVEKYLIDKEYSEFIKLLKYFVDVQESKIDEVNIIVNRDGTYKVTDINGDDIIEMMISGLTEEKYTGMVNMEDVIVSGLITTAPKRIIIHGAEYCRKNELIDTIKNVFLERVAFCEGCSLCEGIKETNLKDIIDVNLLKNIKKPIDI